MQLDLVLGQLFRIGKGVLVVDGIEDSDQERTGLSSVYLWRKFQGETLLFIGAVVMHEWLLFLSAPLILVIGTLWPVLSASALALVHRPSSVLVFLVPAAVLHAVYYNYIQ